MVDNKDRLPTRTTNSSLVRRVVYMAANIDVQALPNDTNDLYLIGLFSVTNTSYMLSVRTFPHVTAA